MSKICGIYKITSPSNRIYIGQSIDIKKRIRSYKNNHCKEQTKLARSLQKYGFDSHNIETVIECLPEQLNELEIFYIKQFGCLNPLTGLNLKAGGQSGGTCSEEAREKLRVPKSEAAKEKYRLAAIGRIVSEETRAKHSVNMKGNKNLSGSTHMTGFRHTEATREIIKEKRKNQIMPTGFKRPWSEEQRRNKSIAMSGKANPKYKDGKRCKPISTIKQS